MEAIKCFYPELTQALSLTHHWPNQVTWPCLTTKGLVLYASVVRVSSSSKEHLV